MLSARKDVLPPFSSFVCSLSAIICLQMYEASKTSVCKQDVPRSSMKFRIWGVWIKTGASGLQWFDMTLLLKTSKPQIQVSNRVHSGNIKAMYGWVNLGFRVTFALVASFLNILRISVAYNPTGSCSEFWQLVHLPSLSLGPSDTGCRHIERRSPHLRPCQVLHQKPAYMCSLWERHAQNLMDFKHKSCTVSWWCLFVGFGTGTHCWNLGPIYQAANWQS